MQTVNTSVGESRNSKGTGKQHENGEEEEEVNDKRSDKHVWPSDESRLFLRLLDPSLAVKLGRVMSDTLHSSESGLLYKPRKSEVGLLDA